MRFLVCRAMWVCAALVFLGCEPEQPSWSGGDVVVGSSRGTPTSRSVNHALTGASIVSLEDGRVVVADPNGDRVQLQRNGQGALERLNSVTFEAASQPTRIASMKRGEYAVVLHGRGEIAHYNGAAFVERRAVCPEPRGIAWDEANDALKVACASGELVTVGSRGVTTVQVGEELRDVLLVGGATWVTTFRSAELLELDAEGRVITRLRPPPLVSNAGLTFSAQVAWRTVASGTQIVMAHQAHLDDDVTRLPSPPGTPGSTAPAVPQYYGAATPTCLTSVVSSAVTVFDAAQKKVRWSAAVVGSLPVDVSTDGTSIALVTAGDGRVVVTGTGNGGGCISGAATTADTPVGVTHLGGHVVAVDRTSVIELGGKSVPLGDRPAVITPARALFHAQSPSGVACASCHAEGHDDGHVWNFGGKRVRTQALEGGLLATAPFHWKGELRDIGAVLHETFEGRMGGTLPTDVSAASLGAWLDDLPSRRAKPAADVSRGEQVFLASGCASCHAGPALTNNRSIDVGTGGVFQVPSLRGVKFRGPWMHDGCAKRLADRFTVACGGSQHPSVAPGDVEDVVKYLESL